MEDRPQRQPTAQAYVESEFMRLRPLLLSAVALALFPIAPSLAQDRYTARPPVVVSPDLSAPWVMQLGNQPGRVVRRLAREEAPRPVYRRVVRRLPNGGVLVQPDRQFVRRQSVDQMQTAAVAMAAGLGTSPLQKQLARAVGLYEVRLASGTTSTGSATGVVAAGKRIGKRIYLTYERSLSTAEELFRVSYQLTRNWSVRTESSVTDAVDLLYSISFD